MGSIRQNRIRNIRWSARSGRLQKEIIVIRQAGIWQRDGSAVFRLMSLGFRDGVEHFRNEYYFHVYADPLSELTPDQLAEQILNALRFSSPQPSPNAAANE
jgi:hypothetical protein